MYACSGVSSEAMTTSASNIGEITFNNGNTPWMTGGLNTIFNSKQNYGYLQTERNRFLEIHPDGFVRGSTEKGIFGLLFFCAHFSSIVIQGGGTGMYLCMDDNSHLYSSKHMEDKYCTFNETLKWGVNRYHHKHFKTRLGLYWYVAIDGSHSRPGKLTRWHQQRVKFTKTKPSSEAEVKILMASPERNVIQELVNSPEAEWAHKMETISNKTYEYLKNEAGTGRHLEILPSGKVRGSKRKRATGILEVYKTPWKTIVFKGYISCQYLCMNSSTSLLYASKLFNKRECQFYEDIKLTNSDDFENTTTFYQISYKSKRNNDRKDKRVDKWPIAILRQGIVRAGNEARPSQSMTKFVIINATRNMLRHKKVCDYIYGETTPTSFNKRWKNSPTPSIENKRKRRRHKKERKKVRKIKKELGITTDSASKIKDKSSRLYRKWCQKTRRKFFTLTSTVRTLQRYKVRCQNRTRTTTANPIEFM